MSFSLHFNLVKKGMNRNNDNKVGTAEALKRIGISAERLRYWERAGVVRPEYVQCGTRKFRRYSREDLIRAALIKKFIDVDKYTLQGAIEKVERICELGADKDAF